MSKSETTYKGQEWKGGFDAVGQAMRSLIANSTPVLFYIVALLFADLLSFFVIGRPTTENQIGAGGIQGLVSVVLLPFMLRYQLELARGGSISSISQLLRVDVMLYLKLIAASLVAIALVLIGIIPLLIPLIWIIPWVCILCFPIVKHSHGPLQALKYVRQLSAGRLSMLWTIVGISLLLFLATIPVSLVPGLSTIVSAAVSMISGTAFAIAYLWLEANRAKAEAATASE